ncbi:hypothetical protein GO755_23360 [Spirosoma sp. HMF4905]|uniref:Lipocalin-like domain-containing protein n=1 Tax=Spirosoma arboris TaxID=2682092 RepID=A0A7K1SGQ6_9BACT|nr:hypothetical protein [Spirosoma arboris]MVM32999.1 hypothetical protein [Spirosoma arboris]
MTRWLIVLMLLATLVNCHSDKTSDDSVTPVHGDGLPGTWLLAERGYSPGAGYIIDKIPSKPEQTLTFAADGHMQAQGDDLKAYQTFSQFRLDTTNQMVLIHFAPNTTDYYERVYLRNDTLKLYQSCYEGCHLGFLRIK